MKTNIGVIVLLAAAAVVIGLVYFNDSPTHSSSDDTSDTNSVDSPSPPDDGVDHASTDVAGSDTGSGTESPGDRNNQQGPTAADLQEKYAEVSNNPDYPQLQKRLDALRERHPDKSFDAEQVVDTLAQREAWNRVEEPPEELPLTRVEKFDGREFVEFNPSRIEVMMPGDTLQIPIWQSGERYTMRVDRTETHQNGSVTWHGHLEDFREKHRVTLTVGDGLSVGGLDTPRGHYVLQAHDESGWIASSETLFKRNQNETDMIVPPVEESEQNQ